MIKYTLKCSDGHKFESWFQNSDAFDTLDASGQLSCAICGGGGIEKALMAPKVNLPAKAEPSAPTLDAPMSKAEEAMKELRTHVEANSEDVGERFADEVRAMHYGEAPERSVIGEAKHSEAAKLLSEGIPVAPLPWSRQKPKAN